MQERDPGQLTSWVTEVLSKHSEEAARYLSGESKILGYLVGQVMHRSGGAADPRLARELLIKQLSNE